MQVEIDRCSVRNGEDLTLTVRGVQPRPYDQLQVDIFTAGTPNAEFLYGKSAPVTESIDGSYSLRVETDQLRTGYCEIGFVRLSKATADPHAIKPEHEVLWQRRPEAPRLCFEVTANPRISAQAAVLSEIELLNEKLEYDFLEPICAALVTAKPAGTLFAIFVFVRRLLIGGRMRFAHHEMVPIKDGLESNDELHVVNEFLRVNTKLQVVLKHSDQAASQYKQANPACVFHYPAVLAQDSAKASSYAIGQTQSALLALSLSRGGSGEIFSIVVVDDGGGVINYAPPPRYVGNLLTGPMVGDSASQVGRLTEQLKKSAFDRFLVALYKEALSEASADFQYVRFWMVLEALADARNYDEKSKLLDYQGEPMMNGVKPIDMKSSLSTVFALFRDSGIGSTEQTWETVSVWFGFRNAVAHHGAMENYPLLSQERLRECAEKAYREIKSTAHDRYLWQLKEDAKLLLLRKLDCSPPWC